MAENSNVENYFAEQPSGRNLLHVHVPAGAGASNAPAAAATRGAQPGNMGAYSERPSGRGLVHQQDGSELSATGPGREGGVLVSPEVSESEDGSSRWGDSEAMSGLPYSGGGQSTYHTEAASAYRSSEAAESAFNAAAAMDRAGIDALDYSEGSAAASRIGGESVVTVGVEDTAAGGSSMEGGGGALSGYGGTVASRESRQQQLREAQEQRSYLLNQSSTSSSMASRVDAPFSELGGSNGIIGQSSWRSSPQGAGRSGIDRVMSGDTSDSSALLDGRAIDRDDTQEDGDFGTVWLANRAHARQYDAQGPG